MLYLCAQLSRGAFPGATILASDFLVEQMMLRLRPVVTVSSIVRTVAVPSREAMGSRGRICMNEVWAFELESAGMLGQTVLGNGRTPTFWRSPRCEHF